MNSFDNKDLKINGSGSFAGGEFDTVKVNGSGRITSDVKAKFIRINGDVLFSTNVEAGEFKVYGNCRIDGNLNVDTFKVYGSSSIEKDIKANEMKIYGDTIIKNNLSVNRLSITGSVSCDKSIKGENIDIYGELITDEDLEGENVKVLGAIEVNGLLNAEELLIESYGTSKVKDIGATTISIKENLEMDSLFMKLVRLFKRKTGNLIAETIEGDNIYLEKTTAKIVRGNNIVIGKGCNIELVEYRDSLNITDDAKVDNSKEIDE
ncbi:hypothetical protein CLPU_8c00730 [Gottschalkia purinilytica]|uniref:Integral membrane protein CcmA involved in cell shape determination n=1 Tax=Gottschalkia purinilytica TaxID=1503 RepID=A0A0L0W9S3_GOTPU|nr:hypothetical protein [Gottschalkia purinilytica]KNF08308.1 hypothetical protein CLPU_8c00730 [Gottschalkia purinilytica]